MTPELKKQMKAYKRQRQWRIIREHTGEALLFAFPMLLASAAFFVTTFSIIVAVVFDISPSTMWGL